jgi:hypothetical protein
VTTRLLIIRVLLGLATLGAIGAALSQLPVVLDAGGATKVVETWRLYGFPEGAGPSFGGRAHGGIADTSTIIAWDGSLAVVLIVAFILALAEGKAKVPSPARS